MTTTETESLNTTDMLEDGAPNKEYHLEKLQEIETEYTRIKQEVLDKKIAAVSAALDRLQENKHEEVHARLLQLEDEIEKRMKDAARKRDKQLDSAKAWLDAERIASINSYKEQFRYAIRNRFDALSCLRYNLKLAKRDMDADPPPFEARVFKVKSRIPIWNGDANRAFVPFEPGTQPASLQAELHAVKLKELEEEQNSEAIPLAVESKDEVISTTLSNGQPARKARKTISWTGPCIIYQLQEHELEDDLRRMDVRIKKKPGPKRKSSTTPASAK
ncbi:uncharacterized protein MONBRDRAFT_29500 [Monosiga brevicollis MX1]|uniref:Uncharacterized protein n=1 Tax=Monosiga brevicollis TaxID=81824 RepID=A9VB97_MONBE|nr:uncharacterized protein MONBRDRAFT_29500 [Monosiga brevicollis MX1]EDQ85199.1 predicted protein [Monosiga brevicollis MX1]|eukprot:XP_001750024.1 hypothetical protein [Monosiga brevicollis MX1]